MRGATEIQNDIFNLTITESRLCGELPLVRKHVGCEAGDGLEEIVAAVRKKIEVLRCELRIAELEARL